MVRVKDRSKKATDSQFKPCTECGHAKIFHQGKRYRCWSGVLGELRQPQMVSVECICKRFVNA